MPASDRLDAHYVLPLRWSDDEGLDGLTDYLRSLAGWLPVIVVDGSPPDRFEAHARRWAGIVDHCRPEPRPGRNGKVAGVMTGVRRSGSERIVIADDDVRYDEPQLRRVVALLDEADLVRPQNYFAPLPWHARWDTARSLINRSVASDYPGTFALRRSTLLSAGGYDGDVLFENLEMIRTIRRAGGRERRADEVFVARTPPSVRHFVGQRVRQAYDSLAQPGRLVVELSLLPGIVWSVRRPWRAAGLLGAVLVTAETGRRRNRGRVVFSPWTTLFAPAWTCERAVCVWIAVARRLTGGVPYRGTKLTHAATPRLGTPFRPAPVRRGRRRRS